LLVLTGALVLGGAALAKDLTLPKMDAAALKGVCNKAGGKFSEGPQRYGCGTNCHGGPGTDCIVNCARGEKCNAQVIGARRPHSVAEALTKPERRRK
jgi:hypothetical protein